MLQIFQSRVVTETETWYCGNNQLANQLANNQPELSFVIITNDNNEKERAVAGSSYQSIVDSSQTDSTQLPTE